MLLEITRDARRDIGWYLHFGDTRGGLLPDPLLFASQGFGFDLRGDGGLNVVN